MVQDHSLPETVTQLDRFVRPDRLLNTALSLLKIPSPTGTAGEVLDLLAHLLSEDGFLVERQAAGHDRAPAVLARFQGKHSGRCLQFNGHLDVVHLPFVPPFVEGGRLRGSGASDMKGGLAAAIEALRVIRDSGLLQHGCVLLCGHDLHEAPWGFGQQLDSLITAGQHGDAVLIPEPLTDHLPIRGRGSATWKLSIRRAGEPVHEVMRPQTEPDVIRTGARCVEKIGELNLLLEKQRDVIAGAASVFIGQFHAGEIYNQYPQDSFLEGTRRWLPGDDPRLVREQFLDLVQALARESGTTIDCDWRVIRDSFHLDPTHPFVGIFQECCQIVRGKSLPEGPKLFVDDGNSFWALARIPAITHGPRAGGQHTVQEWSDIDDMVRVARLYAATAVCFLNTLS